MLYSTYVIYYTTKANIVDLFKILQLVMSPTEFPYELAVIVRV